MSTSDGSRGASHQQMDELQQASAGTHAAEAPMQANQHMDDQTRNALSKIYYGH